MIITLILKVSEKKKQGIVCLKLTEKSKRNLLCPFIVAPFTVSQAVNKKRFNIGFNPKQ